MTIVFDEVVASVEPDFTPGRADEQEQRSAATHETREAAMEKLLCDLRTVERREARLSAD
ncbi:MAG: hypothetical protein KF716_07285 [Anaerolineae bacterium]|nr:hypothetical protein [Anaerolineae bacterium]